MDYDTALEKITRAVGSSIDHDHLEEELSSVMELEGIIWGTPGVVLLEGTRNGEIFDVTINIEIEGEL